MLPLSRYKIPKAASYVKRNDLPLSRTFRKIIHHIFATTKEAEKIFPWIQAKKPGLPKERLGLILRDLLTNSFKENLRILLITDELTTEQKESLASIICSFKLERGKQLQFAGYVVRLSQRILLGSDHMEYALSVE